jgi:hypothetical protein
MATTRETPSAFGLAQAGLAGAGGAGGGAGVAAGVAEFAGGAAFCAAAVWIASMEIAAVTAMMPVFTRIVLSHNAAFAVSSFPKRSLTGQP